ncbi:MAG TPA: hypothetical protein VGN12_07415 [Pirellulales bacterium]|jgi:hypothetical protein
MRKSRFESCRLLAVVGCATCILGAIAQSSQAQQASPKAKAPAAQKAPAAAPARPNADAKSAAHPSAEDSAARDQILHSPQWQQMLQDVETWLASQTLYDAAEVKQIQARLHVGISRMNPSQLQWFENDMEAKLRVLTSDQAKGAEAYLAQTLAVASPTYARKLRQKLPDVLTATAAQISHQLSAFSAKQDSTVQIQQAFADARQANIAANQAQAASRQQVLNQDLDRESAAVKSAVKGNDFSKARDYFPNAGNDGPFGPGTSIGFFGGGFF